MPRPGLILISAVAVALALVLCGCEQESTPAEAAPPPAAVNAPVEIEPWVPHAAITADVVAVLRIDMARVEASSVEASLDALQWNRQWLREPLADFERLRSAFVANGGEAMVIAARLVRGSPDTTPWQPMILLRVDSQTDASAFAAAIDQAVRTPTTTRLVPHVPGWLAVQGEQLADPPRDGQPDPDDPLLAPFAEASPPPVLLTMRMTPDLDALLSPHRALLADALVHPLEQWTGGAVGVTPGNQPRLTVTLRFGESAAASTFEQACRGMLGQAALQLTDADADLAAAVGRLQFVQHAGQLTLELDPHAGRCVSRLWPVMAPALFRTAASQ